MLTVTVRLNHMLSAALRPVGPARVTTYAAPTGPVQVRVPAGR